MTTVSVERIRGQTGTVRGGKSGKSLGETTEALFTVTGIDGICEGVRPETG